MKTVLVRTSGSCFIILVLAFIFYSCKKESYVTIEGKLLLSNTNPVPISNYKLYFFQSGSPGIPFAAYSLSSDASTTTDNNGNYSVKFKQGESGFLFFRGTNSSPIDMRGETFGNFPGFAISNISPTTGTIYLYKKISNATLIISTVNGGFATGDSLFIDYNSTSGPVHKFITGITVAPGTTSFTLDTITDLALLSYDFIGNSYQNDVLIKLKKAGQSYTQYINPSLGGSIPIPPGDETNKQLTFYMW